MSRVAGVVDSGAGFRENETVKRLFLSRTLMRYLLRDGAVAMARM